MSIHLSLHVLSWLTLVTFCLFHLDILFNMFILHTGSEWGLRLLLNIEQYEYMQGPHQGAGVKVLIHDHDEIPRVMTDALTVPPGSHSEIKLQYTQVKPQSLINKIISQKSHAFTNLITNYLID